MTHRLRAFIVEDSAMILERLDVRKQLAIDQ